MISLNVGFQLFRMPENIAKKIPYIKLLLETSLKIDKLEKDIFIDRNPLLFTKIDEVKFYGYTNYKIKKREIS